MTTLPVPRDALADLGLDDEQIAQALACPPLVCTGEPVDVPDREFRVDAVHRVLRALRALRHTKTRRWAGKPLNPDPWQIAWILAPVFGWHYPDGHPDEELAGTRITRTLWVEVPRKNTKTTLASGLALVLLAADGEQGAEVYAAATDKDQAKLTFGPSRRMAETAPALRGKVRILANVIEHPASGSVFRPLSSVAEAAHGLNVHAGIIDEVHVHRSRDLIDAIETGTGARDQPLIVFITTADDGDDTSIYGEKHSYTVKCADRVVRDPSHYGVIWAATDADDPFAETTWRKANPGLGTSVTLAYLRKEAAKAEATPSYFNTFLRLHLNRRTATSASWFHLPQWDRCGGMLGEPDLAGRDCYGGLDLASTGDFAAWVLLFPPRDGDADGGRWKVLCRLWLPRAALNRRGAMHAQLSAWERGGWIDVTVGDVTDYAAVEHRIGKDAVRFNVIEVAYDPWNATDLVLRLQDSGMALWPLQQSIARLNGPAKWVERQVGLETLNHGGHPVLRWMASNAITRGDMAGNIAPDKKHSAEKIDGVSALVNAAAAAIRERPDETSVYESRGLSSL